MTSSAPDRREASPQPRPTTTVPWAAVVCAAVGFAVFHFFGNVNRGYIDTASLFYWWGFQWVNPGSETEHGWLILGASVWLLWRNLRATDGAIADCGTRNADFGKTETGDRKPEGENRTPDTGHRKAEAPASESGIREFENPQSAIRNPQWARRELAAPIAAMLAGLALHALGFAAQQARVSIVALLVFAWGVLRLGGGRRWGAAAAFPLTFLVFAIPISVLDEVGLPLRLWVTNAGEAIARAAGIEVLRSGTQLVAPDGRFHYDVAAPCSGVRSLVALTALSLLLAYLNFRSWPRRLAVLALCFPLVYLGNVARIVAIVFAAQWGGTVWGERAHEVMGYGVFVIVLGGVLAAVAAIRRWWPVEARRENVVQGEEDATANARADLRAGLGAAGLVVAVAVGEMVFLHRLATAPPRGDVGVVLAPDAKNPVELPAFIGTDWIGQRAEVSAVEREVLPPDTGYSRKNYAFIADRKRDVFLSIVLSGRDRTSIHRPELCLVGQGWTIDAATQHAFRFPSGSEAIGARVSFPATVLRVRREVATPRGKIVVPQLVAYWFVGGDAVVASHGRRFLTDAWNRVARARADRWAYVLMQTDASDGEAAALARMQTVLNGTLPAFQRVDGE